jgi:hypothetical protein
MRHNRTRPIRDPEECLCPVGLVCGLLQKAMPAQVRLLRRGGEPFIAISSGRGRLRQVDVLDVDAPDRILELAQ